MQFFPCVLFERVLTTLKVYLRWLLWYASIRRYNSFLFGTMGVRGCCMYLHPQDNVWVPLRDSMNFYALFLSFFDFVYIKFMLKCCLLLKILMKRGKKLFSKNTKTYPRVMIILKIIHSQPDCLLMGTRNHCRMNEWMDGRTYGCCLEKSAGFSVVYSIIPWKKSNDVYTVHIWSVFSKIKHNSCFIAIA